MKGNKTLKKVLSAALITAMLLSSFTATSFASASMQDMNPGDDAKLGMSYPVSAIISLAAEQTITLDDLTVASGTSSDAFNAAALNGEVTYSLVKDNTKPYLNDVLYPNQSEGGEFSTWKTSDGKNDLFTDIKAEIKEDGNLDLSFDKGIYFIDKNGNVDPSAPHSNGGAYLDICGYYNLQVSCDGNIVAEAPAKVAPYENFHTMNELYVCMEDVKTTGTANGLYVEYKSMGQSTAGREMPYLIIAKNKAKVDEWLALTEKAEIQPDTVLAEIAAGKYNDIAVPVMYSNVHANEVSAADGVMELAEMLVSNDSVSYKVLTGFTAEGGEELAAEMGAKGEAGSVAIPDLIKDKATYLGYLKAGNSISGKVDLDKYYTSETKTVSVSDLLDDVFFIIVPEENVDGRTYVTRASSNGYDLNRDNSFQTTSETANMQALIGKYNPVSFTEFHGRVKGFQCEPCDPPHEPNFEYDLLGNHLMEGGEALGIAAVANNDEYNSYVIPQRDYLEYTGSGEEAYWADPWDDMSTSYTPQFAMLQGTVSYTVELPAYCDSTAQAVKFGSFGQANYIAGEKLGYLTSQVTIFSRGVNNANSDAYDMVGQWLCDQNDVEGAEMNIFRPEYDGEGQNGNFYPECYIIPFDGEHQSNLQAAYDMLDWLTRNDVKANITESEFTYDGVTYPAGTLVVSMYQAKRSVANGALYDGTLINSWTVLYSEGITSFNETRGFDMITVAEPAEYAKIKAVLGTAMDNAAAKIFLTSCKSFFTGTADADVVIMNSSEDSTSAVNALLKAGKKVGFITEGQYKGSFVCSYEDFSSVKDTYIISGIGVSENTVVAQIIKKSPAVYLTGIPGKSTAGFKYAAQVGSSSAWNYDRIAMELMNFDVTENLDSADAVAGANAPKEEEISKIKSGTPYIGYSKSVTVSKSGAAPVDSIIEGASVTALSGAMDCLAYVTYPNETMVNASYITEGDDVMYGYGLEFFSAIPSGAKALVAVDGSKTPTEGFIPTNTSDQQSAYASFLNGGILGFQYKDGTMNVAVFANTLTQKVHQRDEYAYISNFLFSSMMSDEYYGAEPEKVPAAEKYNDVNAHDWFAAPVEWAVENDITSGTSEDTFGPNAGCKRAQAVTFLWRMMGKPDAAKAEFIDVKDSAYYADAVAWAAENDITSGITEDSFGPDRIATRAQFVTFLWKMAGKPVCENASSFSDVSSDAYYAQAVAWAAEKGVTTGIGNGMFGPDSSCTRAQIVTFLYNYNNAQ